MDIIPGDSSTPSDNIYTRVYEPALEDIEADLRPWGREEVKYIAGIEDVRDAPGRSPRRFFSPGFPRFDVYATLRH